MAKRLIDHIVEVFTQYPSKVILVENNDRFLYRNDVQVCLKSLGIDVIDGSKIQQRIAFELREGDRFMLLLTQYKDGYLEDVKKQSTALEFSLSDFFTEYHIPSLKEQSLEILDQLFKNKPLFGLSRQETLKCIEQIKESQTAKEVAIDIDELFAQLNRLLSLEPINWAVINGICCKALAESIGHANFDQLYDYINAINIQFQQHLEANYAQLKHASAVKKPKIVSKVLDHLRFHYADEKIALIVIDGLAFWQYELLKKQLPAVKNEDVIYSWLPSITQLSRQAIFRGNTPNKEYKQNPLNEEKLWKLYWTSHGSPSHEIHYQHEKVDLSNIAHVTKLALVFTDLDAKMHASTDYVDLKSNTQNWIQRTKIASHVEEIIEKGFRVFITTDHGNVEAKGWRGLKGREKLGTNKSGSRSERHIEYTEPWLKDEFLENNPEINSQIAMDDQSIYFKSALSFSNKESLVTHGGSHMLEVLIPFIEIAHEA